MKKVLSSSAISRVDKKTMERLSLSSLQLMEIAAFNLFQFFCSHFQFYQTSTIHIFCGNGNNGGDGLVLARMLFKAKWKVKVYYLRFSSKDSNEFAANLNQLNEMKIPIEELNENRFDLSIQQSDVVIDALFGSGLNRSVQGFVGKVIDILNQSEHIIAIDIPSGLMAADNRNNSLEHVIKATATLSIQVPKLCLFQPSYAEYIGEWHLIDIGLDHMAIEEEQTPYYFLERSDIKKLIKPSRTFAHKGTNGHGLLISGSYGMMGAAVLSANAALRSGVGLLSIHTPKCGVEILQQAVPQAMVEVDIHQYFTTIIQSVEQFKGIGIGPGLGQAENTQKALHHLLQLVIQPLVIDADALNILASHQNWLSLIPTGSILTPHPGEFKRLVGEWNCDEEKLEKLKEFCGKVKSYVILKGAFSCLCTPEGLFYFNSTGNEGMAKGGSGDVLTGILTALLAQGYTSESAAMIGMMVHGLAGDIAAESIGKVSMNALDLIEFLPNAFMQLND